MASPQRGEPGIAVLYAWPSNEELAALAVGERLNMDVVAKAEVSPEGEFELRLADGAGLSEYSSESGDLNLLLSAEFDGSVYEYNVGLDSVAVENAEPGEAAVESVAPEPVADVEVSIVGVKLPATTAWSKSGKTTYRFKSKGGKLCGAKSHANDRSKSPGSIVAK